MTRSNVSGPDRLAEIERWANAAEPSDNVQWLIREVKRVRVYSHLLERALTLYWECDEQHRILYEKQRALQREAAADGFSIWSFPDEG